MMLSRHVFEMMMKPISVSMNKKKKKRKREETEGS